MWEASPDKKVLGWIKAAEECLEDKMLAANSTDPVVVFRLTEYHDDSTVYEKLKADLSEARSKLEAHQVIVEMLMNARVALAGRDQEMARMGTDGDAAVRKKLDDEMAVLQTEVEQLIKQMMSVYGSRKKWDWVKE